MPQKVLYRTIKARHTARPQRIRLSPPAGGFAGLLARLDQAGAQLDRARIRRKLA